MMNFLSTLFSTPSEHLHSTNGNLQVEVLEQRQMLSTVSVFAQGSTGDEALAIEFQGRTTAVIDSFPTDGFQEFQFQIGFATTTVDPSELRFRFFNDEVDPASGFDRNITIDRIEIDGNIYQTENAATFSTGTWTPQDGVQDGFGRGETLHANGFFQYSQDGFDGVADTTLIEIDAELEGDLADFEIQIDGETVQEYSLFSRGLVRNTFTFRARGDIDPERIRVAFTNDAVTTFPDIGLTIDRNLIVHSITVDGFSYNGSDSNVLSTGTWLDGEIVSGTGRGNVLHANGYFQFTGTSATTTDIVISAAGFGDAVDFELQIDGQTVQNYGLSPQAGAAERTFTYTADGNISADRVRVVFTNDLIFTDPISGSTIDRNLRINFVEIGGQLFDPNDSNVFSTGTWRAEDGVSPGFGRGNFLHANGFMSFS